VNVCFRRLKILEKEKRERRKKEQKKEEGKKEGRGRKERRE
jgi:hypothetical protein